MKNRSLNIVLTIAFVITFLAVNDVFAGTAYSDGRAYLRQGSPTNAGKVYVSTSSATPAASAYKACNTVQTSETTTPSASAQVSGETKKTTYHFFAQANAGYKFIGWYSSTGALQGSGAEHISAAVTSGTAGMDDTHAYLDMHAAFIKIIQMSFVKPTNGSFDITHDGTAISNYAAITVDGKVVLTAHPADGYKLRGWYTTTNGGTTKNWFAFGNTCEPNFTSNVTIGAEFVPDDGKATFWIKGTSKMYDNLNTANTNASSGQIIVVVSDGVVGAGTHTIKSGVTLFIPFDETYNLMTTPKVQHYTSASSAPALSAYRKLTLASGAVINCSGNICIGGQQTAVNGGNPTSQVCGPVGVLDLSRGGTINLKSGSNLYAWGFVKGQDMDQGNNTAASGVGQINAESNSTVWEFFQCGEWRGGTASSTIYSNKGSWKFFPFQSYTIQNVEAPVNYAYGSKLQCHWAIFGNGSTFTVTFPLVAKNTDSSLFKLASGGTLRKWYDPTTDRVCYELGGAASVDALNLNVLGESVSSADYNLPIPANMHIALKSGTTLTIAKPMTMHAGSVVEAKTGSTITLNANVYMYDKDDWDTYCMYAYYFRTYKNLTTHYDRGNGTSKDKLEDATLIANGTINANNKLYVTAHGANICGTGGGSLKYTALPASTTMTQCKTLSDNVSVNIRSANLCNDNGSYTKGIANTTFKNINGRWFTTAASTIKSNKTYDFTYIKSGDVYGTDGTNATVSAIYSKDKTGLNLRDKWVNVKADACDNWWAGIDDSYLYNYTMSNAWHQFIPTSTTIGSGEETMTVYSGSNNKLYTKHDCDILEFGGIDANCLYTVNGVGNNALVDAAFVQIEKNTDDEAYHKKGAASTYYIKFEGCNWHPATKVAAKAYRVNGKIYIWYDDEWIEVENDPTVSLYYSLSDTNVKIYYEYVDNQWQLASPVAEVITSAGTEQVYALETAKTKAKAGGTNVTIRLLKDLTITSAFTYDGTNNCGLDLNGHTLTGTVTSMITINNASATFIIKDQSGAGTGKIKLSVSENARRYGVNVTKGHLILNSGTIYAENTMAYNSTSAKATQICAILIKSGQKFTMNGGTVEAKATYNPYGISIESSTSTIVTINGGTLNVTATEKDSPYGIYGYGKVYINGGTISANAEKSTSAQGIQLLASTSAQGYLEVNGGTINATSKTGTAIGLYVGRALAYNNVEPRIITNYYYATANITGGTINTTVTGGNVAEGIRSYGTTNVSGSKFTVRASGNSAYGVRQYGGTTTISGSAEFDVQAPNTAVGVSLGNEQPSNAGVTYDATLVMNGGKLDVKTTAGDKAWGVYVSASSRAVTITNATNTSYYAGNYASAGTATINDGEINATAKTSTAYPIFVKAAVTQSGASGYASATATPKCTVNGGKFKVASTDGSTSNILINNTAATAANFSMAGGYYSKAPNGTTNIAAGKTVKDLDATVEASLISAGYTKKVAGQEYTVTWCKMGGNTGSNILKTEKVESGKIPVWTGADPDLNTTGVTRVFAGWNTGTWNSGTAYPIGTPLPAITDHDVTYYAINRPIYAEVIADGKDSLFTSAQNAWKYAMKKTQATIRIRTYLGTEASVGNMTQMEFNPDNANSIITLDLNGLSWTMGNHQTEGVLDAENKNVFLRVAPTKANCKLIITDNSASGNGYLMNKWACGGNLICAQVTAGELVLQGGAIKCNNTSATNNAVGVQTEGTGVFTMLGGTIDSKKDGDDVTGGTASGVYCYSTTSLAGGTIKATNTKLQAIGVYVMRRNVSTVLEDGLNVEVNAKSGAYAVHGYGAADIQGGTYTATATSGNARGIYLIKSSDNLGTATVTGNPTFTVSSPSGNYGVMIDGGDSNEVNATINGGTFTVTASAGHTAVGVAAMNKGVVTVKDGTFSTNVSNADYEQSFGAYALNKGTVNVEGGTFNVTSAKVGGNNDGARCYVYDETTLNISGGTFTVTNGNNAVRSFGGVTTITGNPKFTARYGVDAGSWAAAADTAKVTIDGGTFICTAGYALRSMTHTHATNGTVVGDLTVWDGKFYSEGTYPISYSESFIPYTKIRGGYYSYYTSSNASSRLEPFVVSPSTIEAYATTIDGKAYTYRVNTKYNVTWSVNGATTSQTYNRNETPSFGSTPAINDGNTYDFIGWTPEIAPVTTDATYTAVFKKWEAEIIMPNGTSKRYESFATAWTDAQQLQNCTLRLLSNVSLSTQLTYNPAPPAGTTTEDEAYFTNATTTLDLNNHTLAFTGTNDRFLIINKTGSKFIIDDSSAQKNGAIKYDSSNSTRVMCIAIYHGDLELKSGTIYARNTYAAKEAWAVYPCNESTFTMTDGDVKAYSPTGAKAVYTEANNTKTPIVNISGGDILAQSEGTNAFAIYATAGAKITVEGTAILTANANQDAYGVYASGNSTQKAEITIKDGTVNAIVATKRTFGAWVNAYGIINIEGGTIDAHSTVADVTSMWNVEGAHCAGNGILNISGGDISSSNGASPIGVSVHGGTTTITGGKITSKTALHAVDYASATQTATVIVNGGTFIATDCAVRAYGLIRDGSIKNNANVTINGGYFYSTGSYIAQLRNDAGANPSTLVLNGGKYCETSGTTFKNQINALKGSTTTVNDINETVDDKIYKYQLLTDFTVTWKAGTSYTKSETVRSGKTPSNTEVTSFVRNDSTFYFTGWTPTPSPVITDITYQAEGEYHVAKVKIGGGSWVIYDDFVEAWNAVQNSTNATTYITLLNNVEISSVLIHKPAATKSKTTFDLNNFTLSLSGTGDRLLEFNKNDATLTITDDSEEKGGTLSLIRTSTASIYTMVVSGGELKMTGGRIYAQNDQNDANWHPAIAVYVAGSDNAKLTMTGGTVESNAKYLAYGVQSYGITNITGGTIKATSPGLNNGSSAYAVGLYSVQRTTTFGGTAKIEVSGLKTSYGVMASGWISNDGKTIYNSTLNITGGTIDVTATNSNAVGIQVNSTSKLVSETYYGAHGVINVSGGTINVKCSASSATQVFGAQVSASRQFDEATPHNMLLDEKGELNISGGTFTVDTRNNGAWVSNGGNVDMLRSWGTLNVTGGNFTIYQNSAPVGVGCYRNKATVSGNPVFNIYGNDRAYGVEAGPWNSEGYCDADAANNLAEIEVNGGTFNVNAKSGLTIGAWAYGGISANNATTGTGAGYAMNAKVTVNGGEFICYNPTANNSRIFRQENTRTGTYGTATAELIVNGGKFKPLAGAAEPYTSTGTHNVTLQDNNDKHTLLTGGYYVTNTELATHVADTCVVRTLTNADAEYADGYRYAIETNYVAQVKVGSSVKKYTYIKDAFEYFKTVNNATLTVLNDCNFDMGSTFYNFVPTIANWVGTLDLNNHKITGITTADRFFNCNSGNVKTFTITDSSAEKGGEFYYESAYATGTTYGFLFYRGTFNLEAGTLHLNKTVAATALAVRVGDGSYDVATPFNMTTGGKIICESKGTAMGISNYGKTTFSGGEVDVTSTGSVAYGISVYKNNSSTTTLDISGTAKLKSKGSTDVRTVNMASLNTTNITGGTIIAESTGNAARSILATEGTLNISGSPVINATATTTGATGIYINGGVTTTVNGTPAFTISSTDGEVFGVMVNSSASSTTINAGIFNISTTTGTNAFAAQVNAGSATINGGTFDMTAKVQAWGVYAIGANAEVNISGGTFTTTTTTNSSTICAYSLSGATMYITNGSFTARSVAGASNVSPVRTTLNATMNISGGTFDGTGFQAVSIRGGETNITGGTFTAKTGVSAMDWADNNGAVTTFTGKLKISGGTFDCTGEVLNIASRNDGSRDAHSEVTIEGGKFKTTGSDMIKFAATPSGATPSTLTITGGYFNERSGTTFKTQLENYVSDPQEVFPLETGMTNYPEYAYEVAQKRVARVTVGSARTYYTDLKDALDYAKTKANPTITILHDCALTARYAITPTIANWKGTLDLNNKTISTSGSAYEVLRFEKDDAVLTITDDSTDKGGRIEHIENAAQAVWGLTIQKGEVKILAGTIYVKNNKAGDANTKVGICANSATAKLTMSGGKIEVIGAANVQGINNYAGTINISGGEITASTELTTGTFGNNAYGMFINNTSANPITISGNTKFTVKAGTGAYGICESKAGDTFNLTGGTFDVTANSGSAYGIYLANASTINANNLTFNVEAKTADKAYGIYASGTNAKAIIENSTYNVTAKSSIAYGFYSGASADIQFKSGTVNATSYGTNAAGVHFESAGKATVKGGTFTVTSNGTGAYGVEVATGADAAKADIEGGTFTITTGTHATTDYWNIEGVRIWGSSPNAVVNISGGSFTITNKSHTTSAIGIRTYSGTVNISGNPIVNSATYSIYAAANQYVSNHTAYFNISGGTFISGSTSIYAQQFTNGSNVNKADVTITGGKFKSGSSTIVVATNTNNLKLQGGYYSHNTNLENYCVAPKHCLPMTAAEIATVGSDYKYKVVDAYTLTWTTDGDALTGTYTQGITAVGAAITAPATPTKTGYTFAAWTPAVVATMPAANTTYTATWTANTNTAYTVKHYQQNIADDEYTLFETENLKGTTDASVTPAVKTYTGFTAPATQTVTILPDGSLLVEYRYTRNKYTLTWNLGGGTVTAAGTGAAKDAVGTPSIDIKYGASITVPEVDRDGYQFDGWDATPAATMPAEAQTYTAVWTIYVASVKIGSTTTYHTTLADAFTNAKTGDNALITVLQDVEGISAALVYNPSSNYTCTLDLNNHTIKGAVDKLITLNRAGSTFVITDNSAEGNGKIHDELSVNARLHCVYLTAGTLNLVKGTIYSKNPHTYSSADANKNSAATGVFVTKSQTFTMDGGTVESESQYASYAIYASTTGTTPITINGGLVKGHTTANAAAAGIYTYAKNLTVNGGTIIGHAWTSTAYGVYVRTGNTATGIATFNGGRIEATNDTISNKGKTTTYGIYARGTINVPSTSTVEVLAKSRTNTAYAVDVYAGITGNTIEGGTFTSITKTGNTAAGVYSAGDITISGTPTFNVTTATTYAYGINSVRGTVTVNGNPTFNVTCGTYTAYGAFASGTISDNGKNKYSATIKINGGTFNVTSTTTKAYGTYAGNASKTVTLVIPENASDTIAGTHYMPGIIEVKDGAFNVKATTTTANGIAVEGTKTESGAVGTTSRIPTTIVTGGNFKVETAGDDNATAFAMNTSAAATALLVQGGKYSTKKISSTANIEGKYTAPRKSCDYYVFDLPASEDPYKYEVAKGYEIIFKDGDNNTLDNTDAPHTGNIWKEGTTPTYNGTTPTRTQTQAESYTFNSTWLPAITTVTGDATYTAQFDAVSRYFGEQYRLDLIDYTANGTKQKIKINMNTYLVPTAKTQWTVQANDAAKYKNATATRVWDDEDHALTIDNLTLTAGETFVLSTFDGVGDDATPLSRLPYTVPEVITANKTITAAQSSVLYVRAGTLTINGNIEVERVYVNAGAKLVINSGKTLTITDRLVLRTQSHAGTAYAAPELMNNGTLTFAGEAKMYYSRILTDRSQTYPIGFPYSVDLTQTKFSNGKTATKGTNYGITFYNSENRALYGARESNPNWDTYESNTLNANQGYQIVSASDYYYEILFPVNYTKKTDGESVNVIAPGNAQTREFDRGWNYILQPYTAAFDCKYKQPEENIKVGFINSDNRSYCQDVATKLPPATPFFYQADAAGKLTFSSTDFHRQAPAKDRQNSSAQTQWIRLFVSNLTNTQTDVTNIYFNPDKFSAQYDRGYDVAKLSTAADQPLLWADMPYGEMAFTALPDSVSLQPIPLTVYADKAGVYTLYLEMNDYLERLDNLWLYDMQTGTYTDLLLRDREIELTEGTNQKRFYLQAVFKSAQTTTGLDSLGDGSDNTGSNNGSGSDNDSLRRQPRKVMIDGYFFIIMPDGKIYDGQGKVVKQ